MQSSAKRRLSFTANNNHNMGKSPRVFKKTHFNTPLKPTYTELASSPFTPGSTSDNLFQSVPNQYDESYNLMSSPPMAVTSSVLGKNSKSIDNFIINTPVRLALNVGSDGKASIGQFNLKFLSNSGTSSSDTQTTKSSSDPLETPTKKHTPRQKYNDSVKKGKNEILSLLKKMRNGSSSVHSSASKSSSSHTRNFLPSSPPIMTAPETPRSINFSQFIRTGLTPKVNINGENSVMLDQILLDSDNNNNTPGNNKENIPVKPVLVPSDLTSPGAQNSIQFPFKHSVGDPLLINDDVQWTEIINRPHTNTNNSNNTSNIKSTTQPKKFISFGSPLCKEPKTPRPQLDTLLTATNSVTLQDPVNGTVSTNNLTVSHNSHHRQNSLQFTPLIQQTMTGSLSSKFSPGISLSPEKIINTNSIISNNSSISSNNGEIDASAVLKSLITGAN